MKKQYLIATAIAAVVLMSSTSHSFKVSNINGLLNDCLELPEIFFNYANITLPPHLNAPNIQAANNTPPDNPITDAGATLGRVLFYDTRLSLNNTRSCASCHHQATGFSDSNQFSEGFEGGFTGRNSMSLVMARFYVPGHFFWDGRAATLEDQILMPIQDPVEMGLTLNELILKLSNTDYYPPLFEAAFGTPEVTADRVAKATAQFIRSMVSFRTKYDVGRSMLPIGAPPTTPFPNFTQQENVGKNIFFDPQQGNCASCHGTDAFIAPEARNNGLEIIPTDQGLGAVTGNPADIGLFKVPSLRNVELSAPYMHDGIFETLDEVIQHYDHGVQAHPNLSPQLREGGTPNGAPRLLHLELGERAALLAFLKTLTDQSFITDERWSDPFCATTDTNAPELIRNTLRVFPNPASAHLNIRMLHEGAYQLRLVSSAGQTLREARFNGSTYLFDVGGVPAGAYYLYVAGAEQSVQKVVLQ